MNTGDTAFVLISTALVMLMTPGLALFMVVWSRSKNALRDHHAEFYYARPDSLEWVLWGYSLSFGPDHAGLVGA